MNKLAPMPNTWIFDLDNTLYSSELGIFKQVEDNMRHFIMSQFDLDDHDAHKMQKSYFKSYGTTLNGLMAEHNIKPEKYLEYVHDIDLSNLAPSSDLKEALANLQGKRYVFTNGSTKHAEHILGHLEIAPLFDGIFDIIDADFIPKPALETYQRFLSRFNINPETAVMFEDMAKNLTPAIQLGMTGVWIKTSSTWGHPTPEDGPIHHHIEDLVPFLQAQGQ